MGCDIHMVVERQKQDGHWVAVRVIDGFTRDEDGENAFFLARSRNYKRFAALAGVRGSGPEPRGLPTDVSATAKLLYEEGGDHSPSWLPIEEAAAIFLNTEPGRKAKVNDPVPYYFNIYPDESTPAPHRLVFWFDS